MAAPYLGSAFRITRILNTIVDKVTGTIFANVGDHVVPASDSDEAEIWGPLGFLSRAANPLPGKAAAECFIINQGGGHDICIGARDVRGQLLAGSLQPGETCIYAPGADGGSQGRILLKGNGAVAIYTLQGNTSSGASCTIQVLPSGEIHLASPLGGVSITAAKTTMINAAGAGVQLDATGVSLLGKTVVANGSVVLGDATATGVATQLSLTPFMTALSVLDAALAAQATALTAMLSVANPLISMVDAGNVLGTAVATAAAAVTAASTALTALGMAPTTSRERRRGARRPRFKEGRDRRCDQERPRGVRGRARGNAKGGYGAGTAAGNS